MNLLTISDSVSLPIDTVTSRNAIVGVSGSGKTHTAAVVGEEMLAAGAQCVFLDPLGVAWGLRAQQAESDSPAFQCYILGGDHADLPLDAGMGEVVADLIVDEKLSLILDMSLFEDDDQRASFAAAFAIRLLDRNRDPLHVFIDEADLFAPQQPVTRTEVSCRKAFDNMVRRGRVRGIGTSLISQRPAVVAKNLLTQATILITHQLTGEQDRTAVDGWFKANSTGEQRKEVLGSLASLKVGECWVWKPGEPAVFARTQVRRRYTFDSSKTPEFGVTAVEPRRLDAPGLAELSERLASLLTATGNGQASGSSSYKVVEKIVRVEVPILTPEAEARIVSVIDSAAGIAKDLMAFSQDMRALVARYGQTRPIEAPQPEPPAPAPAPSPTPSAILKPTAPPTKPMPPANASLREQLSVSQRKILDVAAEFAALGVARPHRDNIAAFANLSASSGSFATHMASLKDGGFITYPSPGYVALTTKGKSAAVSVTTPRDQAGLILAWKNRLPETQGRILDYLFAQNPRSRTRKEVGEALGLQPTSGSFNAHFAALKSLGLVEYPKPGSLRLTSRLLQVPRREG